MSRLDLKTYPRPRALDLFSGGGGAGLGLRQAGFQTVVGIDKFDHKGSYEHMPGMHFMQLDIKSVSPDFIKQFDFVWASPPCQAHSSMVFKHQREKFLNKWRREGRHMDYIPYTRTLLQMSEVPFVIENVGGAKKALSGELLKLCGTMMDPPLQVFRHRFFERGNGMPQMKQPECRHENCSIGKLGKGSHPPRTEHMSDLALILWKNGGEPPGFKRVEKRYPSHPDRADYVYYGNTPELKAQIKEAYKRDYCRSVKEALRITGDITPLTNEEREQLRCNVTPALVAKDDSDAPEGLEERLERLEGLEGLKEGLEEGLEEEAERGFDDELEEKEEETAGASARERSATDDTGVMQMYPIYGMQLARGGTSEWRMAMGLDEGHMTRDEIRESIPPAYSRYIGTFALKHVKTAKRRAAARPLPQKAQKKRKERITIVDM